MAYRLEQWLCRVAEKLKSFDIGIACLLGCLYFLAVPLTITVNDSGNSMLKLLTLPIGGYLAVSLFFYRKSIELNLVHLGSFLYLLTIVATLYVDGSSLAVRYVIGYVQTFGLLFLMTLRRYTANEIKAFELAQIGLLGIMIALGFIGADWGGGRNTLKLFGATCDPNYFVGFYLLPMAVALKKLRESRLYALPCAVMFALGAYIVVSSGSRGGLLALIVTVLSFVFFNAKSGKQRLAGIVAAVFGAVLFWTVVLPLLPESVSSRFALQAILESRGTGRVDIWLSMLETISESKWELLLGRGVLAQHEFFLGGQMAKWAAHNQFIQALYNQGIPGLLTFLLMSFGAVFRNIKKRPHIAAAMLGMLALCMTLTINTSIKTFWNLLIYAALSFDEPEKD